MLDVGRKKKAAFTLIELLVVIAIIALLLAILTPALKKVKEQAKEVICRLNLHQWGIIFASYAGDHDSKFMPGIDEDWATGQYSWIYALMPYYDTPKIRLCPKAPRTEQQGASLPYTAWDVGVTNPTEFTFLKDTTYKIGSYGINWWVNDSAISVGSRDPKFKWRTTGQKNAGMVPVLMDCGFMLARPMSADPPPDYDGQFLWPDGAGMRRVCTNRHSGGVNILYMDWSSHKVGLKDLWKQEWHRNYQPQIPAWTPWMENLK